MTIHNPNNHSNQPLSITPDLEQPRKKQQRGFTFIELMIVVAIIAVLVAVTPCNYSTYQIYLNKAKVSEAINLMSGCQTPIEKYIGSKGENDLSKITMEVLGCKASSKYTEKIEIFLAPINKKSGSDEICMVAILGEKYSPDAKQIGFCFELYNGPWRCTLEAPVTNPVPPEHTPSVCRD